MLHVLFVAFATLPSHAVARPRVISLCMNLLMIAGEEPRRHLGAPGHAAVAEARAAATRHLIRSAALRPQDASQSDSVARLTAIQADLDDGRVKKAGFFVRGPEDMREVTRALDLNSQDLDQTIDFHLAATAQDGEGPVLMATIDQDNRSRSTVLELVPQESDGFYHRGTSVAVPRGFDAVLDSMANHEFPDLQDVLDAVRGPRELLGGGDLLLFDQFIYRKSPTAEYTYLAIVRLRERSSRAVMVH